MSETTPETSELRERLAEAMQNHDWRAGDGNEYSLTCRHADHRFHSFCAVCEGDTASMADALLPVVAQEIAAAEQRGREEVRARVEAEVRSARRHDPSTYNVWSRVDRAIRAALAEPTPEERP